MRRSAGQTPGDRADDIRCDRWRACLIHLSDAGLADHVQGDPAHAWAGGLALNRSDGHSQGSSAKRGFSHGLSG